MENEKSSQDRQRFARAEERAEMLRQFHESGLTRKAFAEKQGVVLSTLDYWLTREKRNRVGAPSEVSMVFSELKLKGQSLTAESAWAMEVVSTGGVTVRSREVLPAGLLIRLLRLH